MMTNVMSRDDKNDDVENRTKFILKFIHRRLEVVEREQKEKEGRGRRRRENEENEKEKKEEREGRKAKMEVTN